MGVNRPVYALSYHMNNLYSIQSRKNVKVLVAAILSITRTVIGSDYSPAIALSEDKDILNNCDATLQRIILYNPNIHLVNDNVYT